MATKSEQGNTIQGKRKKRGRSNVSIRNRSSVKARSSRGIEPADAFRGPFIRCEIRLLSFVSVRSWFRRGGQTRRVYAHILDHLGRGSWQNWHVWNSSTPLADSPDLDTTIHSSRNRKSQCEHRRALCKLSRFPGVSIIACGSIPVVRIVNRIRQEQWRI